MPDKAKVEAGARVAQFYLLGRLRNLKFFSLAECNAAITEILVQLNGRVMRRLGVSRRELFETVERPDLGDDADEPVQLRPLRRLAAAIARRNREPHHLGNRPGINTEAASRLPMAQTFPLNGKANASIQIHVLHPQPSAQKAKSYLPPEYCFGATE
jgi:hypothetical protein